MMQCAIQSCIEYEQSNTTVDVTAHSLYLIFSQILNANWTSMNQMYEMYVIIAYCV